MMASSRVAVDGPATTVVGGWHVAFLPTTSPSSSCLGLDDHPDDCATTTTTATSTIVVIAATIPLEDLFVDDDDARAAFAGGTSSSTDDEEGEDDFERRRRRREYDDDLSTTSPRVDDAARVALADHVARRLRSQSLLPRRCGSVTIEAMVGGEGRRRDGGGGRRRRRGRGRRGGVDHEDDDDDGGGGSRAMPFVLERTDCAVVGRTIGGVVDGGNASRRRPVLEILLRAYSSSSSSSSSSSLPSTRPTTTAGRLVQGDHDLLGPHSTTQVVVPPLPQAAGGGGITELTRAILSDGMLPHILDELRVASTSYGCRARAACVVLQRTLRSMLSSSSSSSSPSDGDGGGGGGKRNDVLGDAVAFVADGSILPRRSGRSDAPMPSPPCVPFRSPEGSDALTRVVTVDVGRFWRRYLDDDGSCRRRRDDDDDGNDDGGDGDDDGGDGDDDDAVGAFATSSTTVTMRGMIIPRGVTLIVGGGYHGKSTLLQALAYGVYDKVPRDGRERCVSHADAVSVRAEDGRYVHNVNVSAFISNLPGGGTTGVDADVVAASRTRSFGTRDASGSTSQAANVIEAIESGASTMLVDEDVSAANFMARDGRMRAMIMDEPITPLLYRVNGLYLSREHGISTVVVVGGVGEWLDVADAVVLMRDYVAYDGLAKARSVSYQFSYGHVQYAGRGVVHRLPWKVEEETRKNFAKDDEDAGDPSPSSSSSSTENATLSPLRRRPGCHCVTKKFKDAVVRLVDNGSSRLEIYRDIGDDGEDDKNGEYGADQNDAFDDYGDDDDEDDGMIDMSKCTQLVGCGSASEQLYGCGICVIWLIRESLLHPDDDVSDLLDRMERALNDRGMNELLTMLTHGNAAATTTVGNFLASNHVRDLWTTVGFAYRPRRHEVAMALTRMRGMKFDSLPEKPKVIVNELSPEEDLEESKKRALAALWANRRKR